MPSPTAFPRHVVVGLLAVALVGLGLSGCSSSPGNGTGASTPAGGLGSSVPAAAASSGTHAAPARSKSAGSGGGGLALGGGSFCSVAKKVQAEQAGSVAAATDSPHALESLLKQANHELAEFVVIAPGAIKADVQVLAGAEKTFFTAITTANYDITKVPASTLSAFDTPAVTAATTHITSYLASKCGIVEPTDSAS